MDKNDVDQIVKYRYIFKPNKIDRCYTDREGCKDNRNTRHVKPPRRLYLACVN